MNEIPEYLYHYTNVESLAMILKNRSFRFSPLTVLDDLQEEQIKDNRKYGKYVFVSSWTGSPEESIPMWNMYTKKECGVKIKLKINPFKSYNDSIDNMMNAAGKGFGDDVEIEADIEPGAEKNIIPNEEFYNGSYMTMTMNPSKMLKKVEYTDDETKLIPEIEKHKNGKSFFGFGQIGIYKNKYWAFQDEWRYKIGFLPCSLNELMQGLKSGNHIGFSRVLRGMDLPFRYYYLKIDDEAFENMEITLSPLISDGNRVIVESLVKEYNSKAIVNESDLVGLLRF